MELFENYRDGAGAAYDEMFDGDELRGPVRDACAASLDAGHAARGAGPGRGADHAATSTRASPSTSAARSGPFPLDIVPRVIEQDAWAAIEPGVQQRVQGAGDVPRRRLRRRPGASTTASSRAAWSPPRRTSTARPPGVEPPNGVRVHVSRHRPDPRRRSGEFRVLEDNVRVPSGVSYVMTNRRAIVGGAARGVRRAPDPAGRRLPAAAARPRCAPRPRPASTDPTVVVLTPGVYNGAYFEHALLARTMGVELVEGRDLDVPARPGDDADHARASSRCT